LFAESMQRATHLKAAPSLANVLSQLLVVQTTYGNRGAAEQTANELIAISGAHRMDFYVCVGEVHLAWAGGFRQDAATRFSMLRVALQNFESQGNGVNLPLYLSLLAE